MVQSRLSECARGCLSQKRYKAEFCAGCNGGSKLGDGRSNMAGIGSQRYSEVICVICKAIATRWLMKLWMVKVNEEEESQVLCAG